MAIRKTLADIKNPGAMPLVPGLLVNYFKRVSQERPQETASIVHGAFTFDRRSLSLSVSGNHVDKAYRGPLQALLVGIAGIRYLVSPGAGAEREPSP